MSAWYTKEIAGVRAREIKKVAIRAQYLFLADRDVPIHELSTKGIEGPNFAQLGPQVVVAGPAPRDIIRPLPDPAE